jgi:hypothetical protein
VISFIAAFSLIGLVGGKFWFISWQVLICFTFQFFLAHLLAPIKWRSCDENDDERQCLLQNTHEMPHESMTTNIFHHSDLELFIDYKFLTISIGLSFIFALSIDLTKIFPTFLTVSS